MNMVDFAYFEKLGKVVVAGLKHQESDGHVKTIKYEQFTQLCVTASKNFR